MLPIINETEPAIQGQDEGLLVNILPYTNHYLHPLEPAGLLDRHDSWWQGSARPKG
jgi:hypothetical protein